MGWVVGGRLESFEGVLVMLNLTEVNILVNNFL